MELHDDKVCRFLDACWEAGLKNPTAFLISKMPQVYDWLKGVFPRGILPTDVDGEVEINGHFLRLEFKDESRLRDGAIPKGQYRLLLALQKTGRFTVLLVGFSYTTGEPTCYQIYYPTGKISELFDGGKHEIRDLCKRWSDWADADMDLTRNGKA